MSIFALLKMWQIWSNQKVEQRPSHNKTIIRHVVQEIQRESAERWGGGRGGFVGSRCINSIFAFAAKANWHE